MLRATRVVGRDAELRSLSGAVGTVVVSGGAGMGKSTLIRATVAGVGGAAVGRATPAPSPALRPLSELALALVRAGARIDDHRLRLHGTAMSVLLPGLTERPTETEMVSPVQIADALLKLRETAGSRAPALLVLEDLHWGDHNTAAVFESLADAVQGTPITLLATLRPEGPIWPVARRLSQRHVADLVELAPLNADDVRALVVACLEEEPPPDLVDAVAAAEGVPLLVEELLAAYERRGDLCRVQDRWRFRPTAGVLPASLLESVAARLAELSPDDRIVVEAAATLGRDFDATLLPDALGRTSREIDTGLRAALALGLLSVHGEAGGMRFSHALVRDAVLASATGTARRTTALGLLTALEPRLAHDRDLELAAALAGHAGEHARAATLLERAGQRHLERGFPVAAVECFDQALAARPPAAVALGIREALLQALALAGDAERAGREGEVVQRQLEAAGADDGRHRACAVAMVRAAANAGRWADADGLLARGLPSPSGPSSLRALVALNLGRFDEAERAARQVIEDQASAPPSVCEAAEVLGRLARRRNLDEAAAWFSHATATAELHELALWRARALHELATIDQLRTCSVSRLREARDAAIAASAPGLLSAVDFHLAAVHGVRFEAEESLAAARRCLDTARRLGARRQEAWAWNLIGQAHAVTGDRIRADAAAAEALATAGDDPEVRGIAVGTARGLASLLAEDRDRALREWTDAIAALRHLPGPSPLPPWYLWPLLSTVYDVEVDGGARARAETDTPDLRVAVGADGLWHLADAIALGRAGDIRSAGEAASRADERFASVPAFAGYVHLGRRLAAEAAISDGWGAPGEWMVEAGEWFAGRGFRELAGACRSLARRAGVRERRAGRGESAVPADLHRLGVTSREVDVLRLLGEGLTNREIAERLYVSPRTVKGHVENLLGKTGTSNRTQLATMARTGRDAVASD